MHGHVREDRNYMSTIYQFEKESVWDDLSLLEGSVYDTELKLLEKPTRDVDKFIDISLR